jgi:AraC-like DNA-binding protein
MENFFKYTTKSTEDKNWGLYLNVAGYAHILPGQVYPPPGHPSGYNFKWENGRILHEFQLNYITRGEGILETRNGSYPIKDGSVIILSPGMWHRYKPLQDGWKEHYVGFNGHFANHIFKNDFFLSNPPIIQVGFNERLLQSFQEIFNHVSTEKAGYQQICSGLIIYLLSSILSIKKNENFEGKLIEQTIQRACLFIRENIDQNINIQQLARDLNIDYSLFRRMFKVYTGISPGQYHLSLRIRQAKDFLINTDLSIKEISYRLGFDSIFYFSRVFKSKTGVNPTEYKNGPIEKSN